MQTEALRVVLEICGLLIDYNLCIVHGLPFQLSCLENDVLELGKFYPILLAVIMNVYFVAVHWAMCPL